MGYIERGRAISSPYLIQHLKGHLFNAIPGIVIPDADGFITKVEREMGNIPTQNVHSFLETVVRDPRVGASPIGKNGLRREGFMMSVLHPRGKPQVVKLYFSSGLDKDMTKELFDKLGMPSHRQWKMPWNSYTPQELAIQKLFIHNHGSADMASAEILTRMMAHLYLPAVMSEPVALVDQDQKPVGFYLVHDQPIDKAQDIGVEETFFDWPVEPNAHVRTDLPQEVYEVLNALKLINVLPWDVTLADFQEQLLLHDGRFVTFARVGYRLPEALKQEGNKPVHLRSELD